MRKIYTPLLPNLLMVFDRFKNKLAIIPLEGPIAEGSGMGIFPMGGKSPISKAEDYIDEIKEEKKYKALILEINSPGGSPYKSKDIAEKIESLDVYKVARIEEQGASGAYWIACSCDAIIADKLSSVGGVGVLSIRPDISDFLKEMGIDVDVKGKGKFKQAGFPFFKPSEEEEEQREQVLEKINQMFREHVSKNREIRDDEVFEGKVYLGDEAKEKGLIDYIGGREEAIELCKKAAGYDDLTIKDFGKEIRKGPSFRDLFK